VNCSLQWSLIPILEWCLADPSTSGSDLKHSVGCKFTLDVYTFTKIVCFKHVLNFRKH